MLFKTIKDEKLAIKKLYKETQDPILGIYLIAIGKSINELLESGELIYFDLLDDKNLKKVLNNINYDKVNQWIIDKGYLKNHTDDLLF